MTKGKNSEILKRKNLCLLEHINRLVQIKKLKLRLRKVKGHSKIPENEEADKLAKEGALGNRILAPKWPWNKGACTELKWKNIRVDDGTRSFITQLTEVSIDIEWSRLRSITKWVNAEEGKDMVVWKEVWRDIGKVKGQKCRSSIENRDWIFKVKCVNNLLPTLYVLNRKNSSIYSNNTCIIVGGKWKLWTT
jgi:hypothetical protein